MHSLWRRVRQIGVRFLPVSRGNVLFPKLKVNRFVLCFISENNSDYFRSDPRLRLQNRRLKTR